MAVDFKLYLITDRKQTTLPLPDAVHEALKGGVRAIQLREKDLSVRDLLELARELRVLTRKFGAKLFINDRTDVAVAVEADGVHLGQKSMPLEPVRRIIGNNMLIGVSAHSIAEARAAEAGGADFITCGPVFFTPSKAEFGAPVGLDVLKSVVGASKLPVFALGGVKSGNIHQVKQCNAHGVSLVSGIFASDDIKKAAEAVILELQ